MRPSAAFVTAIMFRYLASTGNPKQRLIGSVSRIPATDIEDVIVKSPHEHLIAQKEKPSSSSTQPRKSQRSFRNLIARIDVHGNHLAVRLKSADHEETSNSTDDHLLSIPWQKPPSKNFRQILLPQGIPRNKVTQTRIERRARLVNAIARGRRWLDEVVSELGCRC